MAGVFYKTICFQEINNVDFSGIGGIETLRDALEFILLGFCNVQVCTSGLQTYMASRGISQLADLVGEKIKDFSPASELDRETMVFPKIDRELCVGCHLCVHVCPTGAISSANRMKQINKI